MPCIRLKLNSREAREALDNNYKFNKIEKGSGLTPTYIYFETTPLNGYEVTDSECEDDHSTSSARTASSRQSIVSFAKWNDDCDNDGNESESSLSLYESSKWNYDFHHDFTKSTSNNDDDCSEVSLERNMPYFKYMDVPNKASHHSRKQISLKKEKQEEIKSFFNHMQTSKERSESKRKRAKQREAQITMMYSNALDVPVVKIQEKFRTKSMEPR